MRDIKFSSEDWCKLTDVVIYDPDGWDRKGDFDTDWNKEICFEEFYTKASISTAQGLKGEIEMMKDLGL